VTFRRPLAVLVGVALMLPITSTGLATTPGFDLSTEVAGSTVAVTLEFDEVPPGFNWLSLERSGILEVLAGVVPATDVDGFGRPLPDAAIVLIPLEKEATGIYTGSLRVQEGRWAVVPYPLISDFNPSSDPEAAQTQMITVGQSGSPPWVWISLGVLAAFMIVMIARTDRDKWSTGRLQARAPRSTDPAQ
jgi:hypothetical protein